MTRDERRAAMPQASSFIDEMRKYFGEPQYIKASENGHEIEWGVNPIVGVGVVPVLQNRSGKLDGGSMTRQTEIRGPRQNELGLSRHVGEVE